MLFLGSVRETPSSSTAYYTDSEADGDGKSKQTFFLEHRDALYASIGLITVIAGAFVIYRYAMRKD